MPQKLKDGDYILEDEKAWFDIKGFTVWVRATDEGIVVDIYQKDKVLHDSIASTYAFDTEIDE